MIRKREKKKEKKKKKRCKQNKLFLNVTIKSTINNLLLNDNTQAFNIDRLISKK